MLTRFAMAGAAAMIGAVAITAPATADERLCVDGVPGTGCDSLEADGRDGGVPVGTADVGPGGDFVVEELHDLRPELNLETPAGDDVLYWDGESAMIVPEESGPRLKIADW